MIKTSDTILYSSIEKEHERRKMRLICPIHIIDGVYFILLDREGLF